MKHILAIAFALLAYGAQAQEYQSLGAGFYMPNVQVWANVAGPNSAGSVNFNPGQYTLFSGDAQGAIGSAYVYGSPYATGQVSTGKAGGTANVSANMNVMADSFTYMFPASGDFPAFQGTSAFVQKTMSGTASSSGSGSASVTVGGNISAGGAFIPPAAATVLKGIKP